MIPFFSATATTESERGYSSSVALDPHSALIQQRFLEHAFAFPERPCLEFNGQSTTYGEVEQRSAAIARGLMQFGVQPGQVVAIIAERCDALVWTLLGVLRVGAAFCVVDKAYPRKRIETLLEIAAPTLVVACSLTAEVDQQLPISIPVLDHEYLLAIGSSSEANADRRVLPESLAYYLFTSGSTGKPKCVACNHAPLPNFIDWHAETFDLTGSDRFSMLSGLSHDPVLRDIFTPLSLGATLVIPTQRTITDVGSIRQFLWKQRVSVVHLTPPLGQLILSGRDNAPLLDDVRHFFWGGDKLPHATIRAMRQIAQKAEHTNFYGSTETPQAAAYYRCPEIPPEEGVPIGRGTRGFKVKILDSRHRPVPQGQLGEIAIVSRFLSLGYMDSGYIVDPCERYSKNPEERVYYTGDQGCALPDGNILVIGRSDDQVKIRGYRLNLSEVTALLCQHPQVASAIALAIGPEDARKLAAFVAPNPGAELTAAALNEYAAASLPSYMVPSDVFFFPTGLSLLPNGKIDREALIEQANNRTLANERPSGERISDPILMGLIEGWSDLFHRNDIYPESTFNDLGGDSLTYVGAYLVAEELLGTVPENWQNIPLRELAQSRRQKKRHMALVDSTIVMRALSISMIVALHVGLSRWGYGATAALFIISGYLFGKTAMDNLFLAGRGTLLLRPLRSLFIPTLIFAVFAMIYSYIRFDTIQPAAVLMMADIVPIKLRFFDSIWYLNALIKIIIACACLQSLAAHLKLGKHRHLQFIAIVAGILCLFRLALPYLLPNLQDDRIYNFNFISNMGLFYLGILLLWLHSRRAKLTLVIALVAYTALCVPKFGIRPGVYMLVSVLLVLFVPRIPVPRLLSRLIYEIAANSLYIYLVHAWVMTEFHLVQSRFSIPAAGMFWLKLLDCILGIGAGIAVARAARFCRSYIQSRPAQLNVGAVPGEEVC